MKARLIEIVERPRRRAEIGVPPPGQAHVHGRDGVLHDARLDALALQRPGPVDHVGQERDAHAGGDHAAHRLDRGGAEDHLRPATGMGPVAAGGLGRLVDGQHDVGVAGDVGEADALLAQESMLGRRPEPPARAQRRSPNRAGRAPAGWRPGSRRCRGPGPAAPARSRRARPRRAPARRPANASRTAGDAAAGNSRRRCR